MPTTNDLKYDFHTTNHTMTRLTARVGTKGQAVIPKEIRDRLGIRPGDTVTFTPHGNHVDVRVARGSWDELLDALPRVHAPDLDVDAAVDEGFAEEWRGRLR